MFRRPTEQDNETIEQTLDPLTGLPDRWQFEALIEEELHRTRRNGDRFGVFLIGISNLAQINTAYGSAVGDSVLQRLSDALVRTIGGRGTVARYVGSEIAVCWPGLLTTEEVRKVANEMLAVVPPLMPFDGFSVPITLAIGGVSSSPDATHRDLMLDAESSLAEARYSDGDKVAVRLDTLSFRARPEVMAVRLQRAFDNHEFQLHFQPIVSMTSGTIIGFESMLRWLDPDGGPLGAELVRPGAFLDVLRSSPVSVPLHLWILRETAAQISVWSRRLGNPSLLGAINLDVGFVLSPEFRTQVLSVLDQYGLRPTQLLLDLNGRTAGPHIASLWPVLAPLKTEGVGIALEDFGLGFGSADLLRRCRFDVVRLPRVLIGGLGLADEDRILVNGLTRLAHDLGCYVVAEGVETDAQAEVLRSTAVDLAQGYRFGKPASSEALSDQLDSYTEMARGVLAPN